MNSLVFDKAISFAAKAHKGQLRKGTDIPYISHPYAVAMILCQQHCTQPVIIAGLLHDVLEDTVVTELELTAAFGDQITAIVKGCSEPNKSLPWEERKQHTINYLKEAPFEVKCVSCADKLHNLRSMQHEYDLIGDKIWARFNRGYDLQKWYAQQVAQSIVHGVNGVNEKTMFTELLKLTEEFFAER